MHEECEILNLFQEKFFSSSQSHEQTHDYLNYIHKGYDAWKNISNKQMDQPPVKFLDRSIVKYKQ